MTRPIDAALVRALLAEQFPELAEQPIHEAGRGWDNQLFRIGQHLQARLPRRPEAAELVAHELRWVPEATAGLPDVLPVPGPARAGRPGCGYPWVWAVVPWIPGADAAVEAPDPEDAAERLGRWLRALHRPAPAGAPTNPWRGIPLAEREPLLEQGLAAVGDLVDAAGLRRRLAWALQADPWDGPPRWLHGDLHPRNLVVQGGRLAAVIDFGDLCCGDPATDLAVAWTLFDRPARSRFQEVYGGDPARWQRAEGWAVALLVAYLQDTSRLLWPVVARGLDRLGIEHRLTVG